MSRTKIQAIFDHRYPGYDRWQSDDPEASYYFRARKSLIKRQYEAMAFKNALEAFDDEVIDYAYERIESVLPAHMRHDVRVLTPAERLKSPEADPDYRHWLMCETWTLEEAVALALNKDPAALNTAIAQNLARRGNVIASEYTLILDLAERWAAVEDLPDNIEPKIFVEWILTKSVSTASEFREAASAVGASREEQIAALEHKIQTLETRAEKASQLKSALRVIAGLAVSKYNHTFNGNSTAINAIRQHLPVDLMAADGTIRDLLRLAYEMMPDKCRRAIRERDAKSQNKA